MNIKNKKVVELLLKKIENNEACGAVNSVLVENIFIEYLKMADYMEKCDEYWSHFINEVYGNEEN